MTMDKKCGARFSNMLVLAKPYLLCVGLQFGMAGTFIITKACLDRGMSRFVLTVYRNAVAAFVLAPFAIIFERCYTYIYKITNNAYPRYKSTIVFFSTYFLSVIIVSLQLCLVKIMLYLISAGTLGRK